MTLNDLILQVVFNPLVFDSYEIRVLHMFLV